MHPGSPTRPAALALAAALLLAACGDNQDPGGADALWKSIHDEKYTTWEHAPGYATKQTSNSPHGDEVVIFVNDKTAAALAGGPISEWPVGSRIVKEGYEGGELSLVAVMDKREGGWYWAEYDPEGSASFSGEPSICTNC